MKGAVGLSIQIFTKGALRFSHKKEGVGKIGEGEGCLKKGWLSLIFIKTDPFHCYLSECFLCVFC